MAARALSIKSRITVTLVLLPLISLVVVGAIALLQNRTALAQQGERNLERLALEKTRAYDTIFQRIQQEVQATAHYAEAVFRQPLPQDDLGYRLLLPWTGSGYGNATYQTQLAGDILRLQRLGVLLGAIVSNNPYLTLGYVGTESGITVFHNEETVNVIEAMTGFDPRTRPWYLAAEERRGPIWTDLYVDAHTKTLTVTAAAPVYGQGGKLIGVVGFDVLLETLQNDILTLDIGYAAEPFMINSQGLVIVRRGMDQKSTDWDKTYHTDNLLETSNPALTSIVQKMIGGSAGIELYRTEEGTASYLAYAPVPTVGASLGIAVPRGEIVRPVQESGKLVIVVLAIFVIAATGTGLVLGGQVTRPIEELTVLVDKASKGLVEVEEIPIQRMDEIGLLAGSFNRMIVNLGTVLKELEQREMAKK